MLTRPCSFHLAALLPLAVTAALTATLGACSNVQPIPAGTCGNGVIETGEDCDLFTDPALGSGTVCGQPAAPPPERCRYVCTGDDGAACPDGWACNRSGVCQFASGVFSRAQGSPFGLTADSLAAGDIDGDRTLDLAGVSGSALRMRFGAGNGQFPTPFDIATPTQTGPPAIGHIDTDQTLDAMVLIGGGLIIARGQPDRSIAPLAALTELGMFTGDAFHAVEARTPSTTPGPGETALKFFVDEGGEVAIHSPGDMGPSAQTLGPAPARRIANLTPVREADLGGPAVGATVALAFTGDDRVHLLEMTGTGPSAAFVIRPAVTLQANVTIRSGALWTDVDGDGDLDLVISVTAGAVERVAIALQAGGAFGTATIDARFDVMRDECLLDATMGIGDPGACSPFPAGAGDIDGDGRADYVSANRIYQAPSGGPLMRGTDRQSAHPWTEAVVADFNDDGAPDIAAASAGEDGVDFLMGNLSGVFTHARISTDGAPLSLVTGDFDGDFVTDLALAEILDEEAFASVVFGEPRALPRAVVKMGRFDEIHYLDVARKPVPQDLTDELMVDTSDPDEALVSTFLGTSERQMVSPLEFGPPPFSGVAAAVMGDFDGDGATDIAAVTDVSNTGALLWLLPGPITGESPGADDDIPLSDDVAPGAFDFACARWLAGDVDGDGDDELIAVDHLADCFRPGSGDAGESRLLILDVAPDQTLTPTLNTLAGGVTGVRELSLVDVDLDGALDLVVAYGGATRADGCTALADTTGVAVYWDLDPTDRTAVDGLPTREIPSVVALNADDDPALELAIWTESAPSIADLDDQRAFSLTSLDVDATVSCGVQILAGDADGDAIPDIILGDGERVEVHLALSHIDAIALDLIVDEAAEAASGVR